jgi:WD40 repeat protein
MAFTQDSHTLVTGDEHGVVRLWDVGSLKQTMIPAHERWVKGLAVSSTGETLVTGATTDWLRSGIWPRCSEIVVVGDWQRTFQGTIVVRCTDRCADPAQRLGDLILAGQA